MQFSVCFGQKSSVFLCFYPFKLETNDHSDEAGLPIGIEILALLGCLPLPKGYA